MLARDRITGGFRTSLFPRPPGPYARRQGQERQAAAHAERHRRAQCVGRAAMLPCRPTAAYHRREDVVFVPVEGASESALGLVWHRDGEAAAVREFVRTVAGRAVSPGKPQVVA